MNLNKMEQSIINEYKKIYRDGCVCERPYTGAFVEEPCSYCVALEERLRGAGVKEGRVLEILDEQFSKDTCRCEVLRSMDIQSPCSYCEKKTDLVEEHSKCMPEHPREETVGEQQERIAQTNLGRIPGDMINSRDVVAEAKSELPIDQWGHTAADELPAPAQAVLDDLEAKRREKMIEESPTRLSEDEMEAFMADGWEYDIGRKHWWKPSLTPLDGEQGERLFNVTPTAQDIKEVADAFAEQGAKILEEAEKDAAKEMLGIGLTITQTQIKAECEHIRNVLIDKNRKYGDSALDPERVFSQADPIEQLNVRIDDKLSRIKSGQADDTEDTELDLIGYLILKRVYRALEDA